MTAAAVRTGWRWLRTVGAVLVVAAAVEYGVVPRVVEAASELSLVSDLSLWLLAGAGALELLSLAAYTGLTQRLLGPVALPTGTQLRIDLTGYGLSHVVPGGGATAAAVRYRLMVARGVPEAPAASLAAVQTVLAALGLVLVWALGSLLSLPRTGSVATAVLLVVLGLAAALGSQWLAHGGRAGAALVGLSAAALRRVPARVRSTVSATVRSAVATVRDTGAVRAGLAWSATNWLLDAGCLWLCLRGYGADVAPELVLVSYGIAMLAGLLPITPGGVGVVEGLLVPGLVAAGGAAGPAVLAVLTWRLLQFWLPIPVAAGCWVSLVARRRSGEPGAAAASGGGAVGERTTHGGLTHLRPGPPG